MPQTADLLTGFAEYLAELDLELAWRPDGIYAPTETGIVLATMPPTPHSVVALTPYPVTEYVQGIQVRCRREPGPPTPVWDLTDDLFERLHGLEDIELGGVPVALIWRASVATLGADQNGRHETTANYYLTCAHPSAHDMD